MIKFTNIDDKNMLVEVDGVARPRPKTYKADATKDGKIAILQREQGQGNITVDPISPTDIWVNGTPCADQQDALVKLNTEMGIGNFKSGGVTPTPSDWTRPFDRPTPPTFTPSEQSIYMLFGVAEKNQNDFAFRITESSGSYLVDWGDGTVETVANNVAAEHTFNFATLDKPVGSEGYKWVWIKFTRTNGNITEIFWKNYAPKSKPLNFVAPVFEIYVQASEVAGSPTTNSMVGSLPVKYYLCDIFYYFGSNKQTSLNRLCYEFYNLKRFKFDFSNATNCSYVLVNCYSYNEEVNIYAPKNADFSYLLTGAKKYNKPLTIKTDVGSGNVSIIGVLNESTAFNSDITLEAKNVPVIQVLDLLYNSQSFNSNINVDFSKVTNGFNRMLNNCGCFNKKLPTLDAKGRDCINFMANIYSYNKPLILQNVLSLPGAFLNAYSLPYLRLPGLSLSEKSINISNTAINATSIMDLKQDLPDRTGIDPGTLTITNTPATVQVTDAQVAEFSAINWTVVR